jgi:hypothetical protein
VWQALAESGEFDEFELGMHRERMRQFTEAMAMGGDEFVDAVHVTTRGAGKPPKLRRKGAGTEEKLESRSKPGGWLRFLRGSKKEVVDV